MPSQRSYIVKGFMGGTGFSNNDPNTFFNSYDMRDTPIFDAKVEKEINKVDSLSFVVGAEHPFVGRVKEYRTWIMVIQYAGHFTNQGNPSSWVTDAQDIVFFGRVVEVEEDLYGNKNVSCESAFAFFNDVPFRLRDNAGYSHSSLAVLNGSQVAYDTAVITNSSPELNPVYPMIDHRFKDFRVRNSDVDQNDIASDDSSDIDTDVTVLTVMDFLNEQLLENLGGAIYTYYEPQATFRSPTDTTLTDHVEGVVTYLGYRQALESFGIGTGSGGCLPYNGSSLAINSEEYPRFVLGENIVDLSKEQALDTIYTGVFPVGKDGLLLTTSRDVASDAYEGNYIWHTASSRRYGRIAIALDYPNITTRANLRTLAQKWINTHASDGLISEYKYTVTGPEPVVLGYGDYFIKPLYGVLYCNSSDVELANAKVYPCLSMELDLFNSQNNRYTFGPFVSDNYADTSISTKLSNKKSKKKVKKK